MTSSWLGHDVSIGDVPTPLLRFTTETWLIYGGRTISAPMRLCLARTLSKAIPGSSMQQHDLRRVIAAEVLRAWHTDSFL